MYEIFVVEDLRLELRFVELVMGLEIVHRTIEKIDLFRPGHFEIIGHLLGHEILCDRQETLRMKELILLDEDAEEFVLPIKGFFAFAIGVEYKQLIAFVLLVVENKTALVELCELRAFL